MPKAKSEYEVEELYIDRLDDMGYEYVDLKNYDDVYSDDLSDLGTHFIKFCIHDSKAHTCSAEIQATQNKIKLVQLGNAVQHLQAFLT